jgi:protein SCO1/2
VRTKSRHPLSRHPLPRLAVTGVAVLSTAVLLAGCGGAAPEPDDTAPASVAAGDGAGAFHGTMMDPAQPRPDLTLRTTSGDDFALDQRPDDEITVLFFGYTHCPDLCPTTMADLARARAILAPDIRERVQVVFVTEDPARDTPELLRTWLDRFDPEFTGLIGGNEATAAAMKQLYLPESAQVAEPSEPVEHAHEGEGHTHGDYGVDHAGIVYTWAPGDRTVIYTGGTTPEQYAEDLTRLATP